ncbi:phosphatases II [Clavulina sp. PMI_390]|nr:phosphatases II [Clavulina sp. PMI_390]
MANNFVSRVELVKPITLGNMILSSCPGKKVRLTVKNPGSRSAINRDLTTDLKRIASLGVKLIINCLSDEELAFLGSPWPTYVATANKLGLDVLRVPMPEGLAPLSVVELDWNLESVVKEYTAKGVNVLAHCRGGVGRAGLIACCWMIKLGVCGSLPPAPKPEPGTVRRDTLDFVQAVIRAVRMRRSLKAIETYEQVKFLVDYVEHLRSTPYTSSSSSSTIPTSPPKAHRPISATR